MSAIGTGLAEAPADLSTRWVGDHLRAAAKPQCCRALNHSLAQGRAALEMWGGVLELLGPGRVTS